MAVLQITYIAAASLLIFIASATSNSSCGNGWVKSTESRSCLIYVHDRKTWHQARTQCQALGGDLVKIVNSKMNKIIYQLIEGTVDLNFGRGLWWIGLHATSRRGEFHWLDEKKKAEFTDWLPGRPETQLAEVCTAVEYSDKNRKEKWSWDDENCNGKQSFICEKVEGKTLCEFVVEDF
ncbi:C-type lectin [Elysia marginata]|uniref:C-type lectin n=1 Tax=Elysia marginata TaxID=1093978 RepID=A0AAV4GAD0_9GAST|nr:C-type lectin [Elysia marginata]